MSAAEGIEPRALRFRAQRLAVELYASASKNINRYKQINCYKTKTLYANIPTSSGAAQWLRAQVGNCKVVDSRFGSRTGQMYRCVLGKDT